MYQKWYTSAMDILCKKLEAHFYKSASGKEPVREWLLDLNKEDRKTIGVDIKTIEFGWPIGMPVCKPLGRSLFEVRSTLTDKKIARLIFCIEGNLMILLHGFIKKTQKMPEKELDLAYKRLKELTKNG